MVCFGINSFNFVIFNRRPSFVLKIFNPLLCTNHGDFCLSDLFHKFFIPHLPLIYTPCDTCVCSSPSFVLTIWMKKRDKCGTIGVGTLEGYNWCCSTIPKLTIQIKHLKFIAWPNTSPRDDSRKIGTIVMLIRNLTLLVFSCICVQQTFVHEWGIPNKS